MERTPISKRLRFEVFKRDSFKCQYCGASAPEVCLHIDHMKAVIDGGSSDITNLITACAGCNLGKGPVALSDDSVLQKSRRQLEDLQERREQLEMLMEWREGLRDIAEQGVERLAEYWYRLAPGFTLNEHGKQQLRKWSKRYTAEELTSAMNAAADQYIEFTDEEVAEEKSWNAAFLKIPAICKISRMAEHEPEIKELYYIRGILRNRLTYYFNHGKALEYLRAARSWDVSLDELRQIAVTVSSWTQFQHRLSDAIGRKKAEAEREAATASDESGPENTDGHS
jgi:hypothetical protein